MISGYINCFSLRKKILCLKISKRNVKAVDVKFRSKKVTFFDDLALCDDCYLERSHRIKTCNPLATYSAKRFQASDGLEATERLNDIQKAIYELIKSQERTTVQELSSRFKLSQVETKNQIAILRHLELTKAKRNKIRSI